MNLVDSPTPDYAETGGPAEKPPPWWRRHIFQLALVGLNLILALGVGATLLAHPELLRPSGSLVGRIVNARGGPQPGAQIFVVSAERWATVDSQGRFAIDRIPAGQTVILVIASSPDQQPNGPPLSAVVTIGPGQTLDLGTVSLPDTP
jgi:hypothetical protein